MASTDIETVNDENSGKLNSRDITKNVTAILVCMAVGTVISGFIGKVIGMAFPNYMGAMFLAMLLRNVNEEIPMYNPFVWKDTESIWWPKHGQKKRNSKIAFLKWPTNVVVKIYRPYDGVNNNQAVSHSLKWETAWFRIFATLSHFRYPSAQR